MLKLLPQEVSPNVKAEQVRLLYKQGVTIQLLGVFTAFISISIFWNVAKHDLLLLWLFIMTTTSFIRLEVNRRFNKISATSFDINKWANIYVVGTFISGIIWGSLAFLYEPTWPASNQVMLFVIFAGITAGSFNTNSSYFIAFPAFFLPAILSLMFVILQHKFQGYIELSLLFFIYMILMYFSSLKFNNGLANALELRFENEKIAKKLENSNVTLTQLANIDGLTKLHNRRSMDKFLLSKWNEHFDEQNHLTFILVDIDYFKDFNDTYGHALGDECLIEVATALARDIRSKYDMAARYGGEEFALIFSHTDKDTALKIAERIRNYVLSLKIDHKSSKINKYVTISIGVSTVIPQSSGNPLAIINASDKALYDAKENGRNCIKYLDIE